MSSLSLNHRTSRASAQARGAAGWAVRHWQWLPLVAAFAYFIGLFANFSSTIHSIYDLGDWSGILQFGQAIPGATASAKTTFNDVFVISVLGFELATRWLPLHRELWELGPWLAGLIATGALARAVDEVVGRWAAMIVAVMLVCAGAILLQLQFEWDGHAMTYECVCVLGTVSTLLPLRAGTLGRTTRTWFIWLAIIVFIAGAAEAEDPLFLIAGLVPFVLTSLITASLMRGVARRRLLLSAGAITVGAVVLGAIGKSLAAHDGLVLTSNTLYVVPYNQILDHIGLLAESMLQLFNGDFGSMAIGAQAGLAFLAAASIVVFVYVAWRRTVQQGRALAAAWMNRETRLETPELARVGLIAYWALSAAVVSAAFVFSTAPVDIGGRRYAITIAYAIAVLVAVAAAPNRWSRNLAAVGATIIVGAAAVAMFQHTVQKNLSVFPTSSDAAQVERWAASQHLKYGFAGWWDAPTLSWWTQQHPAIYPVSACGTGSAATLCPYAQVISSWYAPKPHTRSFVLVDNRLASEDPPGTDGVTVPPPALGRPSETAHVGVMTIYVYDYYVARRFGPAG